MLSRKPENHGGFLSIMVGHQVFFQCEHCWEMQFFEVPTNKFRKWPFAPYSFHVLWDDPNVASYSAKSYHAVLGKAAILNNGMNKFANIAITIVFHK